MNIFSDGSSFFCVIFRSQGDQIVLDLESGTESHCVFTDGLSLLLSEVQDNTNKSCAQPWKYRSFVNYHLDVLFLCWHFFAVMPMNVPVLTKVNVEHFFLIDILESLSLVFILDVGFHLNDRSYIHERGCVHGVIFSVLDVAAWLSSSHQRFVLKVISH